MKRAGIGEKYGRLTIVGFEVRGESGVRYADCLCECGTRKWIKTGHLTGGATVSCGCVKRKHEVSPGQRFGRLTVLDGPLAREYGHLKAPVRCDCGTEKLVGVAELAKGVTKSCGCLVVEQVTALAYRHGGEGSPLYSVWHTMKTRCLNPNAENYANYGGRGIAICTEWARDFAAFRDWAAVSGYRTGLEIDRRDVNGDYEPGNCRWVTEQVQGNNRRNNVRLTAFGETKTMADWARDHRCAVSYSTLKQRIHKSGWCSVDAITTSSRNGAR